MRRSLIAGNWKMNGSVAMTDGLLTGLKEGIVQSIPDVDIVVCPPFLYIPLAVQMLVGSTIRVGAQNLDIHGSGAYTGEIAAEMLKEQHCGYVIVGHSERRALYGESSDLVAEKVRVAVAAELKPIVCVGETLEERERGDTGRVVREQLMSVLDLNGVDIFPFAIVAYEPVWAIGTGRTASPDQAQEVHALIRETIADLNPIVADHTRLLYGGSVKPDNAQGILSSPDIDGGLIGGAALVASDFLAICGSMER
ncbi:MAG TPA: triose-phosphate isomerase [Gammaproteobacteria bacterium]|nr:triose-phosphate isomerase [Gammaproteobacteria bacterium]